MKKNIWEQAKNLVEGPKLPLRKFKVKVEVTLDVEAADEKRAKFVVEDWCERAESAPPVMGPPDENGQHDKAGVGDTALTDDWEDVTEKKLR